MHPSRTIAVIPTLEARPVRPVCDHLQFGRQPAERLLLTDGCTLGICPANRLPPLPEGHAGRRKDLSWALPVESVRPGAASALFRGHAGAGHLWRSSLHDVLSVLQIPQELQSECADALRIVTLGNYSKCIRAIGM